jgi:Tfp pilus assembly protein PilF
LGNVAYAGGDLARAERWYRRALELEPRDAATLNNLAVVVAEQGRCGEGSRLVDRAMALTDVDAATAARIAETRAEIAACVEP